MGLLTPEKLNSTRTARTYPVDAGDLARVVVAAVRGLPRWELTGDASPAAEIRAVRRTRLGFRDDVIVRLSRLESGAHTNTRATFESASRLGVWDLGQNRRNLKELLGAIDAKLIEGSR